MELLVFANGTTKQAECCAMTDGSYNFYEEDCDGDHREVENVTHFCIIEPVPNN